MALIEAYDEMGLDLHKPRLRGEMETQMGQVSKGELQREIFVKNTLSKMEQVYWEVYEKREDLAQYVYKHLLSGKLITFLIK